MPFNIRALPFSKLYPLYVAKVERKGRSQAEVDDLLCWFFQCSLPELEYLVQQGPSLEELFARVTLVSEATKIKGKICGVALETLAQSDPLMWKIRCMDKLIDELAKGRPMEKVKRS